MIRLFAGDGTVKYEWPEGLHASPVVRDGKTLTQVQGSNAVLAEIDLADGEQVGESFVAAIASTLVAADVHPIESALAEVDPVTQADAARLDAMGIDAVAEGHKLIVKMSPDAAPSDALAPVAIAVPPAIAGATTEHVPVPSEVLEAAAHALSDAAVILKDEEAHHQTVTGGNTVSIPAPAAEQIP
jgi:hypothetical protein